METKLRIPNTIRSIVETKKQQIKGFEKLQNDLLEIMGVNYLSLTGDEALIYKKLQQKIVLDRNYIAAMEERYE